MAMWNPLRKLFGDTAAPAAAATAAPAAPAAAPAAGADAVDALPALAVLAARFGAGLLGAEPTAAVAAAEPLSPSEQAALAALEALAERGLDATAVPRMPAVLPRLMALARHDDASPKELSELLARDPALVGEVVRLANSPRYRTQRPIEDLGGALMLLGQMGLSQLVMRAAVRPIFQRAQGRLGAAAATRLWDLSERCGHACASQRDAGVEPFAAYLAGTAAPVGLIVALRQLDQAAPLVAPGSEPFHARLWATALRLSAQAAQQWAFPDEVVRAIGKLAGPSMGAAAPARDPLTAALRLALAAALRHRLGAAATADLPPSPAEAALVAELDRAFGPEAAS